MMRLCRTVAMGAAALVMLVLPVSAAPCPPGKKPCAVVRHAAACHCTRTARAPSSARDWALHRPSTPAERAETARLNRELGVPEGGFAPPPRYAAQNPPPFDRAPPMRAAQNPPPFDRDRQMREAYDRRLSDYDRAYPPGYGVDAAPPRHREQVYARPLPPPQSYGAPAYDPPAQYQPYYPSRSYAPQRYAPSGYARPGYDDRLDPWHGYNGHDGLGNGY